MAESFKKTPAPIIFLLLCFLCPTEFSLFVADLRLPPHRVALLLMFPIALYRIVSRRDTRIRAFDVLILVFGVWLFFVYGFHANSLQGFVYGGSKTLETTGAYLVARAWIRDLETLKHTLRVAFAAIIIAALIALPESLFGRNFTHDYLAQLTGYYHPTSIETRLGITRAYGTFDHPIHYGTFCAALLAMLWYSERRLAQRLKRSTVVTGAVFLGLSSAPLICVAIQGGLIAWERLTRGLASRVWLTFGAIVIAYVSVSLLATRSPIALLATGVTLDSSTGFYRLLIWEHGLNNVWQNPMFGLGLADWARPFWMASDTIDSFWLVTAMHTGLPAIFLLVSALMMLIFAVNKRGTKNRNIATRELARGWLFSLIALCFIATTVHFWNVTLAFFFFFIGMAGCIADPKPRRKKRRARHRTHNRTPSLSIQTDGFGPVYGGGYVGQPITGIV